MLTAEKDLLHTKIEDANTLYNVEEAEMQCNPIFDVQAIKKQKDEFYTIHLKVSHLIIAILVVSCLLGFTSSLFMKHKFDEMDNKLNIITDFVEEQRSVEEIAEVSANNLEKHHLPAKYLGDFRLTFYTPFELGAKSANQLKTATSTIPKEGRTIAVDTNIIPKGSIVYISDWGYYIAEDTGSAIKGKRIDIFLNNYEKAKSLGNKKVAKVYLVK